jgi:polyhydroxyalkanoate synthesis regulator phasin
MAQTRHQKDLLTRLSEAGEEAIGRLSEIPGGNRVVEATHALRERLDELQRRVRALDPLEKRVAELERRLQALERKGRSTASRATTAAKPRATTRRTTSSRTKKTSG